MKSKIKAVSLFSSAGIGELYLNDIGIEVVVANELLEKRAKLFSYFYPNCKMIVGDIKDKNIQNRINDSITKDVKLLIATPPCQGLSSLGKNKIQDHFAKDERNYLIFHIFDIIDNHDFDYILIENVPRFLSMYFPYKNSLKKIDEILYSLYGNRYNIVISILDAKDYGVPQTRPRAIIKLFKKKLNWILPKNKEEVSLREAIGHLPSLESGDKSDIPWHYARKMSDRIVLSLHHTPTGKSALKNEVHYPKKENGKRISGFHNTYKRMVWDKPAHARTTYGGSVSSHNNVHPGRKKKDGTYSDPRVLSVLETFIVSSIPEKIKFPDWVNETFIRTVIGEAIPPLMLKEIMTPITQKNDI